MNRALCFIFGAIAGTALGYYIARQRCEEEIESVKEAFREDSEREESSVDHNEADENPDREPIDSSIRPAVKEAIDYMNTVRKAGYTAGSNVATASLAGLQNSLDMISALMSSGIDTSPTITPVIDDSQVRAGIQRVNTMMTNLTVGQNMAMAGASFGINQNGDTSDVVSAINGLRKDILERPQNVYTVNGVTYDDGSTTANAVKTLVRAVKMNGRA